MTNRNGNQHSAVALASGGICLASDTWELLLLEDLGEILRPSRKLAYLWALEKMEEQDLLGTMHKAQTLGGTGLLEGKMAAAKQLLTRFICWSICGSPLSPLKQLHGLSRS